jgi:hypothetical protein
VRVLGEHLTGGAHTANQTGKMLGDGDQSAAVVAEIENEVVDARRVQLLERGVERRVGRLHEVAEEDVADTATVDDVRARLRHGWDRHDALGQLSRPRRP